MSSNLPPGVTTSMIPGNRPEDIAEEEFWQALEERLVEEHIGYDFDGEDELQRVITIARDMGYEAGYGDAQADAQLEAYHREEAEAEAAYAAEMEAEGK